MRIQKSKKEIMNHIKVSIIVPVYNVEKYLKKCLDTIIKQSLKDIEIICVNDGSTDKSREILTKYAKKDSRIVILDKENGGLSSARNAGMKIAKGEYLGFVDSDDWVDKKMFEKLYKNAKEYDSQMSICAVHKYDDTTKKIVDDDDYYTLGYFDKSFDGRAFNHFDTVDFMLDVCVMAWNKIYKRSFIEENQIFFPDGLIFEDGPFFYTAYFKMDRVSLIRDFLYYYRINRPNSIVQKGDKNFINILDVTEMIWNQMKNQPYYEQIKYYFLEKKFHDASYRFKVIKKEYKEEFFNRLKAFEPFFGHELYDMQKVQEMNKWTHEHLVTIKEKSFEDYLIYSGDLSRIPKITLKEKIMFKIMEILYFTPEHYTFKYKKHKKTIKKQDNFFVDVWYCEDYLFIKVLKLKIKLKFNYSELEAKYK